MNIQEQEEMDYQMNMESDYLYEAYGAEARELDRQEQLAYEEMQKEWYNSLSSEEKVAIFDKSTMHLSSGFERMLFNIACYDIDIPF